MLARCLYLLFLVFYFYWVLSLCIIQISDIRRPNPIAYKSRMGELVSEFYTVVVFALIWMCSVIFS